MRMYQPLWVELKDKKICTWKISFESAKDSHKEIALRVKRAIMKERSMDEDFKTNFPQARLETYWEEVPGESKLLFTAKLHIITMSLTKLGDIQL